MECLISLSDIKKIVRGSFDESSIVFNKAIGNLPIIKQTDDTIEIEKFRLEKNCDVKRVTKKFGIFKLDYYKTSDGNFLVIDKTSENLNFEAQVVMSIEKVNSCLAIEKNGYRNYFLDKILSEIIFDSMVWFNRKVKFRRYCDAKDRQKSSLWNVL